MFSRTFRGAVGARLLAGGAVALALLASPAASWAQDSRQEVIVAAGKSQVIELPERFTDVMIADPGIVDVLPLTTRSVYVVGKKVGTTTVTVYGPGKRLLAGVNVMVSADVGGLKARIHELAPAETGVKVSAANDSIILSGEVSSGPKARQIVELAGSYGKVVNMMSVQGTQQVMLSVRFVEMSRNIAKTLRVNAATPSVGIPNGTFSIIPGKAYGQFGETAGGQQRFGIFQSVIRSGDLKLDVLVDAYEAKGLAKTLAEPTLVAMSGDTASFLAGGEFPVPVAQDSGTNGNSGSITVEFKPFGISLAFTPTVLDDGVISLLVAPEVSSIDTTTSVISSGISIPGLKVRRAKTTVELRDGESFAIAGLLANDYRNAITQFPILGDLPIIGTLFRSTEYQKNETELVLVVTPHLAKPVQGRAATPSDHFLPPSDFELFLFGAQRATPLFSTPEQRALMAVDPTKGGLEGRYGHVLE
jgi:pilus assembly protein CpaC